MTIHHPYLCIQSNEFNGAVKSRLACINVLTELGKLDKAQFMKRLLFQLRPGIPFLRARGKISQGELKLVAFVLVDGEERELEEEIDLAKTKKHDIFVVVDRIKTSRKVHGRLADSVATLRVPWALAASAAVPLMKLRRERKSASGVISEDLILSISPCLGNYRLSGIYCSIARGSRQLQPAA